MTKKTAQAKYRLRTWLHSRRGPQPKFMTVDELNGNAPDWVAGFVRTALKRGRLIQLLNWSDLDPEEGYRMHSLELLPPERGTYAEIITKHTEPEHAK